MAASDKDRKSTSSKSEPTKGGMDRKTARGTSGHESMQNDPAASASDQKRGVVSREVHSDHDAALPDTGMDRDSGAGAAGGHDTGGAQASRAAQRSRGPSGKR